MRFNKDNASYIEIYLSDKNGKVAIIIGGRSADNPLERIVSTAELSLEEFALASAEVFEKEKDHDKDSKNGKGSEDKQE